MKKRGWIAILAVVALCSALACSALGGSKGSGRVVKSEIGVSGFSGVTFATTGNLYIEVGDQEELRVEVDDNLVSYFEAKVDSKMLTIKLKDGSTIEPSDEVNFYLTVEELDTIVLAGAGKVEVQSAGLRAEQFSVNLTGSGDLTMKGLTADALDVTISGAGKLEIASGYVGEQTVVISGSGSYEAEKLQSENVSVEITGSGSATVWAVTTLTVKGTGTGTVEYAGKPEVTGEGISVKPISD